METNMKRIAIGLLALLLLGFVYIGISSIKIAWSFRENTRTAEEALNISNEETVRSVIYHTTMTWSSLDAYRNPEIQSQIATGPYLERFGYKFNQEGNGTLDYWSVTKAVTLTNVIVYEFTPTRFRSGACMNTYEERVTPKGEFLEAATYEGICGIYVFVKEQNNWLLIGAFNTTMRDTAARDWHQLPDWLKGIIGDLPDNLPKP